MCARPNTVKDKSDMYFLLKIIQRAACWTTGQLTDMSRHQFTVVLSIHRSVTY